MTKQIKDLCTRFFEMAKIQIDSLDVTCEDEIKNIFYINLQTPDSKLIIGTHGQTLDSLKHLLGRMIEGVIGKICIIHIEVNDYMKAKDDKLYKYIDGRLDYVIKNLRDITLPDFNAYERKKIHTYISSKNIPGIRAYSEGEGKDRLMHISYNKAPVADIDIDGIDI